MQVSLAGGNHLNWRSASIIAAPVTVWCQFRSVSVLSLGFNFRFHIAHPYLSWSSTTSPTPFRGGRSGEKIDFTVLIRSESPDR